MEVLKVEEEKAILTWKERERAKLLWKRGISFKIG